MSDYTNTFGGALKDSQSETIKGVDWDTEYDEIETVIATKTDKVTGNEGDLVELGASGNIATSNVVATNLTGLDSNLQTQLTGSNMENSVTYYAAAGPYHIGDGTYPLATKLDLYNGASEDVWTSVGPTGSGASIIWTDLDALPTSTGTLILEVYQQIQSSATLLIGGLFLKTGDDTDTSSPQPILSAYDGAGSMKRTVSVSVAVNSANVFRYKWKIIVGSGGYYIPVAHLRGFIVNDS